MKNLSNAINSEKNRKKKPSSPPYLYPTPSAKKECVWGLNIANSNSSWKEKVYLSDFYFIQVCFPQSLRGTQHSFFGIFIFISIAEHNHKVQIFINLMWKDLGLNAGFATC